MAYNIVQVVAGESAGAGTTVSSSSFTPTAGASLLALVCLAHSASTSGTTCTLADTSGGNDTWSLLGSANDTGLLNIDVGYRWYLLENAAATATVVQATTSASMAYGRNMVVFEITGLDTSPYLDQSFNAQPDATQTTDATVSGTTGTLASQPAAVIGFSFNTNSGASIPNVGTGYTSVWSGWTSSSRAEHKRVTATTAVQATFTATADPSIDNHYTTVIALKESTGSASAPKRALLMGVG